MGQNHIENNIYNGIKIDKDLNNLMKQEKNFLNNKNDSKKLNDLIKRNIGNNFTRSNFKNIFNRNENGFKNISEILNTIYDNNIYKEQIIKANRSIYEVMFDVRDSLELRVNNNKNDINNKISFDKVNMKLNNNMQALLNQKNIINNSSLNNFNYENDTQKNEINIYQNNNIYLNENQIYSSMSINKNIELKQKENFNFNNHNKNELILPTNHGTINQAKTLANKHLNTNNVFEDINKNKTNNIKTINGKNNDNNFNKDNFKKNINYQEINQYNNIGSINHNKVNNFFIVNNKSKNKDFYIIENDLPKKIINDKIIKKKIVNIEKNDDNIKRNEKDLNEENNNNYIYNKKNINQKKIALNQKTIKSKLYNESKTPSPKKYYDNNDLKKENEVIINYSEKKEKRKNNLFKNDIICKNQEIFIEKSPVRNKEKENKHRKNLFSEQITRKYFTIINNNDNNNKESSNSLNSGNDNIIQKDIILTYSNLFNLKYLELNIK